MQILCSRVEVETKKDVENDKLKIYLVQAENTRHGPISFCVLSKDFKKALTDIEYLRSYYAPIYKINRIDLRNMFPEENNILDKYKSSIKSIPVAMTDPAENKRFYLVDFKYKKYIKEYGLFIATDPLTIVRYLEAEGIDQSKYNSIEAVSTIRETNTKVEEVFLNLSSDKITTLKI